MHITQEALFVESSTGASGYTATFVLPAFALLTELRIAHDAAWGDSSTGATISASLNGGGDILGYSIGPFSPVDWVESGSGGALPCVTGVSRNVVVKVNGLNNDGNTGIARVQMTYSIPDPYPVAVVRG